jgi:hypothetical protein
MISECLNDINEETGLYLYYNQKSPNKLPTFINCKDKLEKQNSNVNNYMLDKVNVNSNMPGMGSYTRYNYDMCNDTLNHLLYTQNRNNDISTKILKENTLKKPTNPENYENYVKNIDIESDLKQFNHIRDKCFNDNFKNKHNKLPFIQHEDIYNKQNKLLNNIKEKTINNNPLLKTKNNCIKEEDRGSFPKCKNPPLPVNHLRGLGTLTSEPVYYEFSNQEYCRDFPCQKIFNNVTKRSMILDTSHRDINPKCLSSCNVEV